MKTLWVLVFIWLVGMILILSGCSSEPVSRRWCASVDQHGATVVVRLDPDTGAPAGVLPLDQTGLDPADLQLIGVPVCGLGHRAE